MDPFFMKNFWILFACILDSSVQYDGSLWSEIKQPTTIRRENRKRFDEDIFLKYSPGLTKVYRPVSNFSTNLAGRCSYDVRMYSEGDYLDIPFSFNDSSTSTLQLMLSSNNSWELENWSWKREYAAPSFARENRAIAFKNTGNEKFLLSGSALNFSIKYNNNYGSNYNNHYGPNYNHYYGSNYNNYYGSNYNNHVVRLQFFSEEKYAIELNRNGIEVFKCEKGMNCNKNLYFDGEKNCCSRTTYESSSYVSDLLVYCKSDRIYIHYGLDKSFSFPCGECKRIECIIQWDSSIDVTVATVDEHHVQFTTTKLSFEVISNPHNLLGMATLMLLVFWVMSIKMTSGKLISVDGIEKNALRSQWFVPNNELICLSLMYRLNNGQLNIEAEYKNGSTEHVKSVNGNEENWTVQTIMFPYKPSSETDVIRIKISSSGSKLNDSLAQIYNIMLCDPESDEAVYALPTDTLGSSTDCSEHYKNKLTTFDRNQLDKLEKNGICHPGLTGDHCVTGCEENRFGLNCTRICSHTSCREMLFCTPQNRCFCASGFKDNGCNEMCGEGWYGPNCIKQCGFCDRDQPCDIFTGKCPDGCKDGYRAPHCKENYKYLSSPVTVSNVTYTTANVTVPFGSAVGVGEPIYLQLLFKDYKSNIWFLKEAHEVKSDENGNLTYHVVSLTIGQQYTVKAILVHPDGGFKKDIPTTTFVTKCNVPEDVRYNLKYESPSSTIRWIKHQLSDPNDCFVKYYDIYMENLYVWKLVGTAPAETDEYALPSDLIDSFTRSIKIRAQTSRGPAKFSRTIKIHRKSRDCDVDQFIISNRGSDYLSITWMPCTADEGIAYYISYQLAGVIPCLIGNNTVANENPNFAARCNATESLTACSTTVKSSEKNRALIRNLKPLSKYYISISTDNDRLPSNNKIFTAITKSSVPDIAPDVVNGTLFATDKTVHFKIDNNVDCSGINGFFKSYYIRLSENDQVLSTLDTKETNIEFRDLQSNTNYDMNLYYVNDAGKNTAVFNSVSFSTRGSLPSTVTSLAVYKKGHRSLTLRWNTPEDVSDLTGFIVSWKSNRGSGNTYAIEPTKCVAWPDAHCHTIENLLPRLRYEVEIRVKTSDYEKGGLPTAVSATTFEEIPEKPQNLTVTNKTKNSFNVSWKNPNMINGALNSFLVNVEEILTPDLIECCKVFPSIELPVKEEQFVYSTEIKDLRPGATYIIGVACKTTWFGAPANVTVQTLIG